MDDFKSSGSKGLVVVTF